MLALHATTIRFADRSYIAISRAADSQGISISQYVREAALIRAVLDELENQPGAPTLTTAHDLLALAREHEVPALVAGTVGDSGGTLTVRTGRATYSWAASKLRTVYFEAIPRRMRAVATDRDGGA